MKKLIVHIVILFLIGTNINAVNLDEFLNSQLAEYKHFSYQVNSLPSYVKSINDPNLLIDYERELRIKKGYIYVPVKISLSSGKQVKSLISLKVKLYKDVLIAVRSINGGELLSSADFILTEKDVSKLVSEPITSFDVILGSRAVRNINNETVLSYRMIESPPVVERGDRLNAALINGTVQVSFFVTAREDGYAGKRIKIVRDDKRVFYAKVVDSKNVIIE